jgi:hypothetical protein
VIGRFRNACLMKVGTTISNHLSPFQVCDQTRNGSARSIPPPGSEQPTVKTNKIYLLGYNRQKFLQVVCRQARGWKWPGATPDLDGSNEAAVI